MGLHQALGERPPLCAALASYHDATVAKVEVEHYLGQIRTRRSLVAKPAPSPP